jgi:hypothetical protein
MENKNLTPLELAIKDWQEEQIYSANFCFDYDSNSTDGVHFVYKKSDGSIVPESKVINLSDFLEKEINERFFFDIDYDGHYMGEYGHIKITLEPSEQNFSFNKNSTEVYCEEFNEEITMSITEEEKNFLVEYVDSINEIEVPGWHLDLNRIFKFKKDFILTTQLGILVKNFLIKLNSAVNDFDFELGCSDFHRIMTGSEENQSRIVLFDRDDIDSITELNEIDYGLSMRIIAYFDVSYTTNLNE